METIIHPDQSDYNWQVETIIDWTTKTCKGVDQIFLKVTWIGGDNNGYQYMI